MKFRNYILILILGCISCQEDISKNDIINNSNKQLKALEQGTFIEPLDTLLNTEKYVALGNRNAQLIIIKKKDSLLYSDYNVVAWHEDNLIVEKNLEEDRFEIYKKFNPTFTFLDYQVPVYNGKLADPDFNKYPEAKRFITRITDECKKGINFAGKYTLVIWGCGSPCQGGAIVDRETGAIYFGYSSTFGSEFKIDSKLIIFNSGLIDEKNNLIPFTSISEVRIEIWENNKFKKLSIWKN